MAKIDVRKAPAGPMLDAACAEAMGWRAGMALSVGGSRLPWKLWWRPEGQGGHVWNVARFKPSTDIAAAWELHHYACDQVFSQRRAYLRHLGELVQDRGQWALAWPEALQFLTPLAICRAFLLAHGIKELEVDDD